MRRKNIVGKIILNYYYKFRKYILKSKFVKKNIRKQKMKPLLTSYLHKKRISVVKPFLKGGILDLGCGPASIIQFLKKNQNYVGIEYDDRYVEDLKIKYPTYNFYTRDLEKDKLNIKGFKFDTILMIAVIEHLAHPETSFLNVGNI